MLHLTVLLLALGLTGCGEQSPAPPSPDSQHKNPVSHNQQQAPVNASDIAQTVNADVQVSAASASSCGKDTDCKGERICEAGVCINPPQATPVLEAQAPSVALEQEVVQTFQQPVSQPASVATPAVIIDELQQQLISAMSWNSAVERRVGDAGAAIRAYVQAGFLDLKPATRMDYSDYRRFKKPAQFLGHELLAIDEEYMDAFVGCCVSPGIAILIRLNPQGHNVGEFVQGNGCRLNSDVSTYRELPELNLTYLPQGEVLEISCKERDAYD